MEYIYIHICIHWPLFIKLLLLMLCHTAEPLLQLAK